MRGAFHRVAAFGIVLGLPLVAAGSAAATPPPRSAERAEEDGRSAPAAQPAGAPRGWLHVPEGAVWALGSVLALASAGSLLRIARARGER